MSDPVLSPGIWAWIWPVHGWPDVSKLAADLVDLGIAGVIPQSGLGATGWCLRNAAAFAGSGLGVCAGFGIDGGHAAEEIADAIIDGLDVVGRCMIDWEKDEIWSTASGNKLAQNIVDEVLTRRQTASGRVTDCPWWAPLYTLDAEGNKHPTHPHAPTKIFGQLAVADRYVQTYGAGRPGHLSAAMLTWARDPSQYASLGSWSIRPAYQGYDRSVPDQVATLIADPTLCLWDYQQLDANCRTALHAVRRLRAAGFDGPGAVERYQVAQGLSADGLCGHDTLRALGLQPAT